METASGRVLEARRRRREAQQSPGHYAPFPCPDMHVRGVTGVGDAEGMLYNSQTQAI